MSDRAGIGGGDQAGIGGGDQGRGAEGGESVAPSPSGVAETITTEVPALMAGLRVDRAVAMVANVSRRRLRSWSRPAGCSSTARRSGSGVACCERGARSW